MRVTPGEGRMGREDPRAWTTKVGTEGALRTGGGRLGGSKAAAGWKREGRLWVWVVGEEGAEGKEREGGSSRLIREGVV